MSRSARELSAAWIMAMAMTLGACARGAGTDDFELVDASSSPINDGTNGDAGTGGDDMPTSGDVPDAGDDDDMFEQDAGSEDAGSVEDASMPPVETCPEENTCALPRPVGSVSGDTGSTSVEASGTGSAFVSVMVTEDDHGFLSPKALRVSATLMSDGADFDLFMYSDGRGCSGTVQSSTNGGLVETVSTSWADGQGIAGEESGRTILIEVRHKEGACSEQAPWSLVIRGN